MKKNHTNTVIWAVIATVFAPLCLVMACGSDESVSSRLVVKGLYLGMDYEDAKKVVLDIARKHWGGNFEVKTTGHGGCVEYEAKNSPFNLISIGTGEADGINEIRISKSVFGASDWSLEEFAQAFMNEYNIPKMSVNTEGLGGYYYNNREAGYRITISKYLNSVRIIEISKSSELKLN